MSVKHALIIGGTGFISTYAVEEFARAGYNVTIITRGSTPDVHGDLVKTRLKVDCDKRKLFVNALKTSLTTVAESQGLETIPTKWDVVVDFICFDPTHAEDVVAGLSGLTHLFIYISTDSVYEVCKPQPGMNEPDFAGRTEEFDELLDLPEKAIENIDDYGYRKLLAEHVFRRAGSDALPYCALRLPDVMGEREYPRCRHLQYQARVMLGLPVYINPEKHRYSAADLPSLATASNSNTTTPNSTLSPQEESKLDAAVSGSLQSLSTSTAAPNAKLLSFVYAGDVATAALHLSAAEMQHRAGRDANNVWASLNGEAFNIGSPERVTLQQYVEMIGQAVERQPYFFSSGKQRLRTVKFSQFAHENSKKAPLEAAMWPPASSYTRIVAKIANKEISGVSADQVSLSAVAQGINEDRGAQLLEKHGLKPWSVTETPTTFVGKLYSNGFEVDSDSSDDDSDDSSDLSSDGEEMESNSNVKALLDAHTSTASTTDLVRRERREDDDMYSYLPSVDQGHISMNKAMRLIPGWRPTPLREWCMRMSVWYAHACVLDILDVDAAKRIRAMVNANFSKAKSSKMNV